MIFSTFHLREFNGIRNIVYTNLDNILVADVLEMNIETKDTKIYMYENKKKVNVKNKN